MPPLSTFKNGVADHFRFDRMLRVKDLPGRASVEVACTPMLKVKSWLTVNVVDGIETDGLP